MLIIGLAHSHTSAIAKFLYDNGVKFDEVSSNWSDALPYDKYENIEVLDWVKHKKNFINAPFPVRDGKAPDASFFLDDITDDQIIFCMRHVGDLVCSMMEKNKCSFMVAFNRISHILDKVLTSDKNIYIVHTDLILSGNIHECRRLLEFCGACSSPIINLSPLKKKPKTYLTYRIENLLFKLLRPKQFIRQVATKNN